LSSHPGRFLLLEGLFGQDLKFSVNEKDTLNFVLSHEKENFVLTAPSSAAMAEGRLSWPARYYELLATRDQLADRLAAYRLLDGLNTEEQSDLTLLLAY